MNIIYFYMRIYCERVLLLVLYDSITVPASKTHYGRSGLGCGKIVAIGTRHLLCYQSRKIYTDAL